MRVQVSCTSWVFWAFTAVVALTYSVIALVTFSNIATWVNHTKFTDGGGISADNINSGMLASCFLGFFSVIAFAVASGIILLSNLFGHSLIGYGFLIGSALNTGFVLLLAGIVLNTFSSYMSGAVGSRWWSQADQNTYVTTWVFSYILTGLFFIMFLCLIFARGFFIGEGVATSSTAFNANGTKADKAADSRTAGDVEVPAYREPSAQPAYGGPTAGAYGAAVAPAPAPAASLATGPPGAWGGAQGGGFGGGWGSSNHF